MSYNAFVKRNVDLAFKLAGDLVKEVYLYKRNTTTFDFADESITVNDKTPFITKCIIETTKRKDNTLKIKAIFKTTETLDFTLYDVIFFDSSYWKLTMPVVNDGYLISVEITRQS
jgi:hypothetical protein